MEKIKSHFIQNSAVWFVVAIPFLTSIAYALLLPVSLDEAATFLLFTNTNIIESATTYPAPNNHIFHSIITNFTKHLPYLSDLFKLRISSIAINLVTLLVLYKFITKHFNKKMALAVVAITSMLFMTIYYSYMSRGYALVNLFFLINLFCVFNLIKGENSIKNWSIFCISSVLGFYTMPSFLYPFVTLNFFYFLFQNKSILKQVVANGIVLLVVVILYFPIVYNEGIGALANNPYVKPIGFLTTVRSLPRFSLLTIQEITGIRWFVMLGLLLIVAYKLRDVKDKITKRFALVFAIAPIVLLSIHCVIPFPRVFFYYSFVIVILICLVFNNAINKLNYKVLLTFLLLMQGAFLFDFERKIYDYENKDAAINITSDTIIKKIIGNKKYLFDESLLYYNLNFELITKGYKAYEIKEVSNVNLDADTVSNFDYIIIKKERNTTKFKKPFFVTDYYSVYKN